MVLGALCSLRYAAGSATYSSKKKHTKVDTKRVNPHQFLAKKCRFSTPESAVFGPQKVSKLWVFFGAFFVRVSIGISRGFWGIFGVEKWHV